MMMRVSLRWIKIFVYDLSVMSGFLDIWMVYIFFILRRDDLYRWRGL